MDNTTNKKGCADFYREVLGDDPPFNLADYVSPMEEFNASELLVAKGHSYSLDDHKTNLNNNMLVVGGSGSGKTRNIVTPNLYQAVGSYIISDPKGSLYSRYGDYLRSKGYKVLLLDFVHPERSVHYNPLCNLRSTQDYLTISNTIIRDNGVGFTTDPFWDCQSTMLLNSILAYMHESEYRPVNFSSILKLLQEGTRPTEDSKSSKLASRFAELKTKNRSSWACSQFENVNMAPQKTYDCIRSTLTAKFANYDTKELREMMSRNHLKLERIGQEKTAVFVTVSDTDRSMDGLANIFFTQAMHALCDYADNHCEENRLPVPVRFILDDFATNCHIEQFPRIISSIRSRGISVMLMVQAESQLTHGYQEDGKTIISNCDTYVYLGGNDLATAQSICLRCNTPLKNILYMQVGTCWVFRRGSLPANSTLLDIHNFLKEMER